jgi:hypothetical protein
MPSPLAFWSLPGLPRSIIMNSVVQRSKEVNENSSTPVRLCCLSPCAVLEFGEAATTIKEANN